MVLIVVAVPASSSYHQSRWWLFQLRCVHVRQRFCAQVTPANLPLLALLGESSGRNPVNIGLLHHRCQGFLGSSSGIDQPREVAAISHPGHLEIYGSHSRIPRPVPISVALPMVFLGSFIPLGPQVLTDLQFHEFVGQDTHTIV